MKVKYALLILIVNLYTISYSQIVVPKNYTELKESPANGNKITRVIFDMDNDHKNDMATIVESNVDFSKFLVLIYLSSLDDQYEIELLHSEDFAIAPVELKVRKNVLEYGYYEDRSAFGRFFKLRFNNILKEIQVIGYDSSYRTSEGNCDKSYNLITGNYEVIITTLNKPKKIEIKKTGNKKISPLLLDNLDTQTLKKMDDIGKQFEPH